MALADTIAANQQYMANIAKGVSNSTSSSTSGSSDTAQTKLSGDLNFFLNLLTTQLKNQDPTQPLDTNQVTQQIATLSSVQQQVNTNKNLETLIGATKQSQLSTAISYIGAEVETPGNTGQLISGQGAFSYTLPQAAASTQITISDKSGNKLYTGAGTTTAGRNLIVWDGSSNVTGDSSSPDGPYTISVTAKDADGKAIAATTSSVGIVSSVQNDASGNLTVTTGDQTKNFSDITAVRAATRVQTSASTADTSQTGTNNASTTSNTSSGS